MNKARYRVNLEIFQTFIMKFSCFGERIWWSMMIFLGLCPCDREIQKRVPASRRHPVRGPFLPRQRVRCGVRVCLVRCAHFFHTGTINASTPQGTPSEKKTSILGTITGGKIKKRSGLLGIFGQNKVSMSGLTNSNLIASSNISNAFNYGAAGSTVIMWVFMDPIFNLR